MNGRQADKAPPAILVLKEVIRDYRAVNDPAGLGELLFPLERCLSGEEYTPPKTGAELNTFNRLLSAAKKGIESYEKQSERGRKGAAATNAKRQAAHLAPSEPVGGRSPEPAPVAGKPPAPVPAGSPAPRPVPRPNPSGGERRGGVKQIGDYVDGNISAFLGGGFGGGDIADRINADPVRAALEITGETGKGWAENTFRKYLEKKGEVAFKDTLFRFNSELKEGEEPRIRGAALNKRLKELPDISA